MSVVSHLKHRLIPRLESNVQHNGIITEPCKVFLNQISSKIGQLLIAAPP